MARLVRVHDPDDGERRVTTVLKYDQIPETLEFLASLPYGAESPFIRGLLHQWVLKHKDSPTLDDEITAVLNGPGGRITATVLARARHAIVRAGHRETHRPAMPAQAPGSKSSSVVDASKPAHRAMTSAPSGVAAAHPAVAPSASAHEHDASLAVPAFPAAVAAIGKAEEDDFFAGLESL
jgi:hypothetical protein